MGYENYELVSEWGNIYRSGGKAVKIYSADTPYEYAAKTARIISMLCDAGLPVPAAYGAKKLDGGETALEMDYIDGKPFIYDGMSGGDREKALAVMAELQCRINAVDAGGFGLPKFSDYLAEEIKETPYLSGQIKEKVFALLARLDTGKTNLCHGDLHSHNILYDGEKHWVIDWGGASAGDPAGDACMTYFYQKRSAQQLKEKFRKNFSFEEIYLRAYCENSNVTRGEILAWLPVIAAYQVNINTKNERDFILDIIYEWHENPRV